MKLLAVTSGVWTTVPDDGFVGSVRWFMEDGTHASVPTLEKTWTVDGDDIYGTSFDIWMDLHSTDARRRLASRKINGRT